ncbi:DeoR family transcriptional regulator [Haloferula sargassicola]|uniref:DeoR family transcriptional regulator n=1 Tax=Haloferula sargassicola TaxID=490096 RepID=UPI003EBA3AD1
MLNERQRRFLEKAEIGGRFTSQDYGSRVGGDVSGKTVRNDLAELTRAGWIERFGSSRSTYYEVRQTLTD